MNNLTREQANEVAQRLANENEQYCLIYLEEDGETFGLALEDKSWGWQEKASVECIWPEGW